MISVATAQAALLELVSPVNTENVSLRQASGRVLAKDIVAKRDQPPFAASAMDGYAVWAEAPPDVGSRWQVIGESAAGHGFSGQVGPTESVRIFTGAPLPKGTNRVLIQEDILRDGNTITLSGTPEETAYVRPAGYDFRQGFRLDAGQKIDFKTLSLLAAMNIATVPVRKRPVVAVLATGDELVQPGEAPTDDQIIASNSYGLCAYLETLGVEARLIPTARDRVTSLVQAFRLARDADLIVTIGGASVGDHDLVAVAAKEVGLKQSFYKVAMRPGKPLMAGRMGDSALIGLPGNPVSALVCGRVFVRPMVEKMLGLATTDTTFDATLTHDMPANGPRMHYMRATVAGQLITVEGKQDSSLLHVLARSNALAMRPPNDPPRNAGDTIPYILF